jgi:hypothetical protein
LWLGRPRTCASYSSIVGESLRYRCGSCASDVSWRCTCWTMLWLVRVLCILLSRCGAAVRAQMQIRSRPCFSKPIFKSSQPVSSLGILLSFPVGCIEASIPDGVVGLQADPLGDGPVLLLGLGQLLLGAERLVGLSQC